MINKLSIMLMSGALLGLTFVGLFYLGVHMGKTAARVDQLRSSVQAENDRKNVDKEIEGLDDVQLCVRIGGMPDECRSVFGVDSSTESK